MGLHSLAHTLASATTTGAYFQAMPPHTASSRASCPSAPAHPARLHAAPVLTGARCELGSMLLAAHILVAAAATAQHVAPDTSSPATSSARSPGARPASDSLEAQAAARVADAVCGKRVVTRCGFGAVLFEAASYDFFGLERAIAASRQLPGGANDTLDVALARAIGGLWWTRELAEWRRWLAREAVAGRVSLGGLDDQPIG